MKTKTDVIMVIHGSDVKFVSTSGKVLKYIDLSDPDGWDTIVEVRKTFGKSFVIVDDCVKQRYELKEILDTYDLRHTYGTYGDDGKPLFKTPEKSIPAQRMMVESVKVIGEYTFLDLKMNECVAYKWRYVLREYSIEKRYYRSKDEFRKKLKRRFGIDLPFPERKSMRDEAIARLIAEKLNYRILNVVGI